MLNLKQQANRRNRPRTGINPPVAPPSQGKASTCADRSLQDQMDRAARVQRSLLPDITVPIGKFRLASFYCPCETLGGDFYDLIGRRDCAVLLVADVMGHGVEAALITMMVKAAMNSVAEELKKAIEESGGGNDLDQVILAHWYAQTYKSDQYVDLHDFCVQTYRRFEGKDGASVRKACEAVIVALDGGRESLDAVDIGKHAFEAMPPGTGCILRSGCSGFAYQHSYGLSIYMPWAMVTPSYPEMAFSADTLWDEFLSTYVTETAREPRFDDGVSMVDSNAIAAVKKAISHAEMAPLRRIWDFDSKLFARTFPGVDLGDQSTIDAVQDSYQQTINDRITKAIEKLQKSGVPAQDFPAVIMNQFARSSSFGAWDGRHTTIGSRHTTRASRYPGDRENAMKNMPPVIGKAYWPPIPRP